MSRKLKYYIKLISIVVSSIAILLAASIQNNPILVSAANDKIVNTVPEDWQVHVSIDTDVSITFDEEVDEVYADRISFKMVLSNGSQYNVKIKDAVISNDKKTVTVTPEKPLEFDRKYIVKFYPYAIDLRNGYQRNTETINFRTNYMPFYDLMVINSTSLQGILSRLSPRELIVHAPKRYITDVSIYHKKRGQVANSGLSEALSNIDINVQHKEEVNRVYVMIMENGKLIESGNARLVPLEEGKNKRNKRNNTEQQLYDIGFAKLPKSYDVNIMVYDTYNKIVDNKVLKVAATTELITEIQETYQYETAGKGYSLQELLSNTDTFTKLLTENDMKKLKVQVVPR